MTTNNTFNNQNREENNTFYKINVAKNVAQRNSQDLTELWKKGELEQGYYYTKYTPSVGEPFVEIELKNYLIDLAKVRDAETVEVLAPVPSFNEWQQMKAFCEEFNALNVAEENQKLKELLKECREYIVNTPVYPQGDDNKQAEIHILVDKINEVLK